MDNVLTEAWEYYKSLLLQTKRANMEQLIKFLDESDFKTAPASTRYHSSFTGGLLLHSLNVYYHMYDFKNLIDFFEIPEESIIITALLHDICKVNCYKTSTRNTKNEKGEWVQVPYYEWADQYPIGHGEKSIILILKNGVQLTDLEIAMIRNHMGHSDVDNSTSRDRVTALFNKYPQALILHWADCLTTFVKESNDIQDSFKERLLGRNISESNTLYTEQKLQIIVDGQTYKKAPENAEVDDKEIILLQTKDGPVKVYSPYSDGLPF